MVVAEPPGKSDDIAVSVRANGAARNGGVRAPFFGMLLYGVIMKVTKTCSKQRPPQRSDYARHQVSPKQESLSPNVPCAPFGKIYTQDTTEKLRTRQQEQISMLRFVEQLHVRNFLF